MSRLEWYCQARIPQLFELLGGKSTDKYAFQDNGSDILAVAHCDVAARVEKEKHFAIAQLTYDALVYSTALDDRLGVFTILEVLPMLGINVDVLLTKDEEIGKSTAEKFVTDKKYNWMVEFDRRGTDVVTYKYRETVWKDVLKDYFRAVGYGSFSDICELEHLECCGVNVGVGYHDEHTSFCYMSVVEYREQLCRFMAFHKDCKRCLYPHEEMKYTQPTVTKWPWAGRNGWRGQYDWGEVEDIEYTIEVFRCPSCSQTMREDEVVHLFGCQCCPMCGTTVVKEVALKK